MTSTPNINTPSSIQAAGFNGATSEIVDTVPELPSASALTHLGKARPKRPKKHAPTRGTVMSRPNEDSSFDEGMDKFYTSSANNSFSPGKLFFKKCFVLVVFLLKSTHILYQNRFQGRSSC